MSEIRPADTTVAAEIIVDEAMWVAALRGGHPGPPPAWMGPFLTVDHFVMGEPTIRPHPHAGFAAVTILFEDSPGSFTSRDSMGLTATIEPGGVHWARAGSGIVHEETPSQPPAAGHGAQIFVDLPPNLEAAPPELQHVTPAQVPVAHVDGARVRVLAGSFAGVDSPIRPGVDVTLLDASLPAGRSITVPAPAGRSAFVLAIRGHGVVGSPGNETDLPAHHAVGFADGGGDAVRVVAGADGLQALFGGGVPLRQPIHWVGGVAMTTRERAEAAAHRYRTGRMGQLEPSF